MGAAYRCNRDQRHVERETSGSNVIRQQLHAVSNREAWPGETCDTIEEKNHGQHSSASACVACLRVYCRTCSPDGERHEHADCGNEEQGTATQPVHQQSREAYRDKERPYLEAAIEERLVVRIGDTDAVQNVVEII